MLIMQTVWGGPSKCTFPWKKPLSTRPQNFINLYQWK